MPYGAAWPVGGGQRAKPKISTSPYEVPYVAQVRARVCVCVYVCMCVFV